MKKFGTPIRAGPGVESEYVGGAALGEPPGFCPRPASSTLSFARPAPERTLESARLTGLSSAWIGSAVEPLPPPEFAPEPEPPPLLRPPCWLPGVDVDTGFGTCT